MKGLNGLKLVSASEFGKYNKNQASAYIQAVYDQYREDKGLLPLPVTNDQREAIVGLILNMNKKADLLTRSRNNHRGRKKPAVVPYKMARTSIFAPTDKNLITDSSHERLFIVKNFSIIHAYGRELGTKHRDCLYAIMRLPCERTLNFKDEPIYRVKTTWRELLTLTEKTHHLKNIKTLLRHIRELTQVSLAFLEGTPDEVMQSFEKGGIGGKGRLQSNVIDAAEWDGEAFDDEVIIDYGVWASNAFRERGLVSLDAEVQFKLKSGYAKSIWPFIDSQPNWTFIDEELLADLCDVKLYEERINPDGKTISASSVRSQFRKECKQAFEDMVKAGGLRTWEVKEIGGGRVKSRRYFYKHAKPTQIEMSLQQILDTKEANCG